MSINVDFRINNEITTPTVLLIAPDGSSKGVVQLDDALEYAWNQELDLVEITPESEPPVCKVMDYGKYVYSMSVKAREMRKTSQKKGLKEVRLRPTTEEHDYNTKMRQISKFLSKGFHVRIVVVMKGREVTHPELAINMMNRIVTNLGDTVILETPVKSDSGTILVTVKPSHNTNSDTTVNFETENEEV